MARKRGRGRRRRIGFGPILRIFTVLLSAAAIVTALTLFFRVGQVQVSGNSRYSLEEILASSGVEQEDNLILLDKYRVAERIYTELPYVKEVRISRKYPDTLLIEVTETQAAAAIQGGGSWWLLSSTGKILEPIDTAQAREYLQIRYVETFEPVPGGYVELAEPAMGVLHMSTDRLMELMGELESRNMLRRANSIDLSDSQILRLGYDGRFTVEMYYTADFSFKMDCLAAAVERLEPNESGTILMTMDNDNEVRFIPGE